MFHKKGIYIIIALALLAYSANAQKSIHIEEAKHYSSLGELADPEYDQLNGYRGVIERQGNGNRSLEKKVFGYHPYWGGTNYLNYQWDLLSDFCYFSYDVDPATGEPSSIYSWLTSPSIDSALANGVNVHLCVTLFSGHSTFFNNPVARQTLTSNLISLVSDRGAQGISLDFEAMPASQGPNMLSYIAEISASYKASMPDGILSIAMPAVDWSDIFDVSILNQYIDLYMIMGYDYYWNGSSQAGPVDPLYSMTDVYDFNVSRTISYYQSEGMPLDRMLIGVPYYAREWPTVSGVAPSSTTANGTAYTWAKVKNNSSGNYMPENKKFEPNSFGPYYAYEDNGWYQCFVNDTRSLKRRYKMVNYRGLAGIGIWALGYDDGHSDLWDVIAENFTQLPQITLFDTLYDSGGPAGDYYNDEDYVYTIHGMPNEAIRLGFTEFHVEADYDTLWIYDGYYPGGELIGAYTGSTLPPDAYAFDVMSLRFKSDFNTREAGWMAIVESFDIGIEEPRQKNALKVYPNPANEILTIELDETLTAPAILKLVSSTGQIVLAKRIHQNTDLHRINISSFAPGVYFLVIATETQRLRAPLLIK